VDPRDKPEDDNFGGHRSNNPIGVILGFMPRIHLAAHRIHLGLVLRCAKPSAVNSIVVGTVNTSIPEGKRRHGYI
jgi:hypothetical protein